MTTDVAPFNPATYVDKVRDKIKQSLIDVVPDEQWNTLLKAEIANFFEGATERDWQGKTTKKPSEFHRLAQVVLEEETKKRIRALLNTPAWDIYWDGQKLKAGEELARLAKENGTAILGKWLESAFAQVLSGLKYQQP